MKQKLLKHLKNKYKLSILFCFLWVVFFTNHDLFSHVSNMIKLNDLEQEKKELSKIIKNDHQKLNELSTNSENLEKFKKSI